MQLFTALDGSLYPVSAIRRIGKAREVTFTPSNAKGKVHTIALNGDELVEATDDEVDRIKEHPVHMVPALPGTRVLRWDGDDNSHYGTAVIAWAYTVDGFLYPVTPDGINDGSMNANHDVLMHDGTVIRAVDRCWENIDEWQDFMKGNG